MKEQFPVTFKLKDGTHVLVNMVDHIYDFHLTRLNSEKHNFTWENGKIDESYETRFDSLQVEAIEVLKMMLSTVVAETNNI